MTPFARTLLFVSAMLLAYSLGMWTEQERHECERPVRWEDFKR